MKKTAILRMIRAYAFLAASLVLVSCINDSVDGAVSSFQEKIGFSTVTASMIMWSLPARPSTILPPQDTRSPSPAAMTPSSSPTEYTPTATSLPADCSSLQPESVIQRQENWRIWAYEAISGVPL